MVEEVWKITERGQNTSGEYGDKAVRLRRKDNRQKDI